MDNVASPVKTRTVAIVGNGNGNEPLGMGTKMSPLFRRFFSGGVLNSKKATVGHFCHSTPSSNNNYANSVTSLSVDCSQSDSGTCGCGHVSLISCL